MNQKTANMQLYKKNNPRAGFTLIELSIVLVIIGLIVGGIVVGKELIRNAQLNKVATDLDRYNAAVSSFKAKYNGLPGNLANATDYWTQFTTCPVVDGITIYSYKVCNGSGNGTIGAPNTSSLGGNYWETFEVFQELALANMVQGSYSPNMNGVGGGIVGPLIGPNPTLGGTVCLVFDTGALSDFGSNNLTLGAHWFLLGGAPSCMSYGGSGVNAIFTPKEAGYLDRKFDDGKPSSGNIIAQQGYDQGGIFCWSGTAYSKADFVQWGSYGGSGVQFGCVLFWAASGF